MPTGWIKMRHGLRRDPRVYQMAHMLIEDVRAGAFGKFVPKRSPLYSLDFAMTVMVGACQHLWSLADEQGRDVRNADDEPAVLLRGVTINSLDAVIGIPVFAYFERVGWLEERDDGLVVPRIEKWIRETPRSPLNPGQKATRRNRRGQFQPTPGIDEIPDSVDGASTNHRGVIDESSTNHRGVIDESSMGHRQKQVQDANPSNHKVLPGLDLEQSPERTKTDRQTRQTRQEKKARKMRERPELAAIPSSLDTPLFRAKWTEWLSYLGDRCRKKPTRLNAEKQLAHLAKFDVAIAVAAIDNSIMNNYQGLFPGNANVQEIARGIGARTPKQSNAARDRMRAAEEEQE